MQQIVSDGLQPLIQNTSTRPVYSTSGFLRCACCISCCRALILFFTQTAVVTDFFSRWPALMFFIQYRLHPRNKKGFPPHRGEAFPSNGICFELIVFPGRVPSGPVSCAAGASSCAWPGCPERPARPGPPSGRFPPPRMLPSSRGSARTPPRPSCRTGERRRIHPAPVPDCTCRSSVSRSGDSGKPRL